MKKTTSPNPAAEEREDDHAPVWLDGEFDGIDGVDAQVEGKERGAQDHGAHESRANAQGALERGSHDADHAHSHDTDHAHSHGTDHAHSHDPDHAHSRGTDRDDSHDDSHDADHAHSHSGQSDSDHNHGSHAGHNLSDVLGLLLAWGATWLVARRPSARYTFGYGSSSILASLANAALLLFACGVIVAEAIERLMNPAPVAGLVVFVVATVGVVVNGFSAWLFMRGQKDDLNIRGAFLHMAADAAISAAVAISGLVILYTNWTWLDPVMSLLVVAVVVYGTWGLLRDSVRMALDAVPPGVDLQRIRDYLAGQPGVTDVHDLHVWALSTTGNALSAHLVMPAGHPGDESIDGIVVTLRERFSMHHATLQVDLGTTEHRCAMDHPHD